MLIAVTILVSVVPKILKTKCLFFVLLLSLLQSIEAISLFAKPPHQLEFYVDDTGGACHQSIALYDGLRLTMQFPHPVRVAVPSHDQVVDLFISGTLIVLSPNQNRAQTQHKISVTAELDNGHAFICTFDLFTRAQLREKSAPVELIRIRSKSQRHQIQSTAIHLLSEYLAHHTHKSITQSSALSAIIETWANKISEQAKLDLMSTTHFHVSSPIPVRAQKHLIYVTIERVIRSDTALYLRVRLHNRSQTAFQLKKIYFFPKGQDKAQMLWPTEHNMASRSAISIEAGRHPQVISLSAPISILNDSPIYFTSVDGRSIPVIMSTFSELSP